MHHGKVQEESAKAKEMERHASRMQRIEEIQGHASSDQNEEALERVNALIDKENKLHEKKMAKLAEMEKRYLRKMEKQAANESAGAGEGNQ